jgi:hypothetical protein
VRPDVTFLPGQLSIHLRLTLLRERRHIRSKNVTPAKKAKGGNGTKMKVIQKNSRHTEARENDDITQLQAIIADPLATSQNRCIALQKLELYENVIMLANKTGWN